MMVSAGQGRSPFALVVLRLAYRSRRRLGRAESLDITRESIDLVFRLCCCQIHFLCELGFDEELAASFDLSFQWARLSVCDSASDFFLYDLHHYHRFVIRQDIST